VIDTSITLTIHTN